jgi:RHS repeat-associated protein
VTGTDGSSAYTYDDTNQLTGADYDFQADESYTYDSNGNRTNAGYVTSINNRLLEDNQYLYEYDIVGNRTKRTDKLTGDMTDYGWDIRDRLTGLVVRNALGDVTKTAQYKYDVYNQRIAKTVDADGDGAAVVTTERYVYGANQNIDLIFDEYGNVNHRYLFGNGVDQIEADESNGNVLWALSDHLGSVRDVVDDSGTVLNHVVYDAFGGVTSQTNASVVFRYGYTARELDAESGLQYNRARYFDPAVGRFISEDPIGFGGGDVNLCRYVGNDAVNKVDPTGFKGYVVSQFRYIAYVAPSSQLSDALGVPVFSNQSTTNIADVILAHKKFGNSVKITFDITNATIEYFPKNTGETFKSNQRPLGFRQGTDHRGHIVGKQLGGKASTNNLFAQDARTNKSRLSGYEDRVTKHLDPSNQSCPVIPIILNYSFQLFYGSTLRPTHVSSTSAFSDGHFDSTDGGKIPNP